jgi:hypothetical protein
MSLKKITEQDMQGRGNIGRPDNPNVSTAEMQRILDELPREVIAPIFNQVVDALESADGAANIGANALKAAESSAASLSQTKKQRTTVQEALEWLQGRIVAHNERSDNPHKVTAAQAGAYTKQETNEQIEHYMDKIGAGDMVRAIYDPAGYARQLLPADGAADNTTVNYTEARNPELLTSGECLRTAFSKLSAATSALLVHLSDKTAHIASDERVKWNVAARPNLLDNSNFLNPVNQRGVSGTITKTGYFIDRWYLNNGSVTLSSSGLALTAGTIIFQTLELDPGAAVTKQVGVSSGTVTTWWDSSVKRLNIQADTACTVTWAKLEVGTGATPWYDKGYAEELEKCKRYYQYIPITKIVGSVLNSTVYLNVPLPVTMRTTPTITLPSNLDNFVCNGTLYAVKGVAIQINYSNAITLIVTLDGSISSWQTGACYSLTFAASADL